MSAAPDTIRQPLTGLEAAAGERSLGRNFLWALAGNVLYSASQWAIIVILAKLGDPGAVGHFALGLAISSPLLTFTNLQLRTVQATDVGRLFSFGQCVALRLVSTGVFLLALAVTAACLPYEHTTVLALLAVAALKAAESFSDVGYGWLQSRERLDLIAQSQCLKAVLSCGLMLATIAVSGSWLLGIAALPVVFWLTLFTFDLWAVGAAGGAKLWHPVWHWRRMADLLRLSLPLGSTLLLVSLNANIPRYFLEHLRDVRDVGVFSALAYVTISANLFVMAFGQAIAPSMAQAYETDLARFRRLSAKLFLVALLVGGAGLIAALAAGARILTLLYGSDYAGEHRVLVCLMAAGAVSQLASAAGYSLTSARFFRVQFPVLIAVCAVTAGASALLVPAHGLRGAAIAQACGCLVQLVCCCSYLLLVLKRGVPVPGGALPAGDLIFRREV